MRLRRLGLLAAVLLVAVAGQPVMASFADAPPDVVSGDPSDLTPQVLDGQVNAIVQVGGRVLVGGTFTKVRQVGSTDVLPRSSLFAYDAATGAVDAAFAPAFDGAVEALASDQSGAAVFVGGSFSAVGAVAARKLAKLSIDTGVPVPGFTTQASAVVQDLLVRGDRLYASGKFTSIGGVARAGLARLSASTGVVDRTLNLPFAGPSQGTMGVPQLDLSPDGATLLAVGNFSTVAGLPRSQLVMIDVTAKPAAVLPWTTDKYPATDPDDPAATWCISNFFTYLRDVRFSPDGRYFVVVSAGGNRPGRLCDTAARWEVAPAALPAAPTWVASTGGDTLTRVSVAAAAVYVGGHPKFFNNPYVPQWCGICPGPGPGAVARTGIAALDPLNGLPLTWNPGRDRGTGVYAFTDSPDGLLVGSDTDHLGGELHPRLGLFPIAGGSTIPPADPYVLPGELYAIDSATSTLTRRSYDIATLSAPRPVPGMPDWSMTRGAFVVAGTLYTGTAAGTLTVRSFTGGEAGPETPLDLHGLGTAPDPIFRIPGTEQPVPSLTDQLKNVTGMFFTGGRLYYTVAGEPRLYNRWFTPQSGVVGAELFVAATGEEWGSVRGLTMASGQLIYGTADGNLWRTPFAGAPTGAAIRIGGPGLDDTDWSSRALFVIN